MKLLVIGSGGREHALVWKLAQSPHATHLWCAPGNAGIAEERLPNGARAECVPIGAEDLRRLIAFAQDHRPDLTVVGPDNPLAMGIVDQFQQHGLRIWGPNQRAARFESSKVFAQQFMERHGIPTARAKTFTDPQAAREFTASLQGRCAVKADGLALGKGVTVCTSEPEAEEAIDRIMVQRAFGTAGDQVVIQELLVGPEVSLHALCDGTTALLFPPSQDHKRALDGDEGPNTGGMGAFSPTPFLDPKLLDQAVHQIIDPWLNGCATEGIDFRGMLYPGLVRTAEGLKVLEFNVRMGDPETQVYLPRLENDLVELLEAGLDGSLNRVALRWKPETAVCVVMASGGYPGAYAKGKVISGLTEADRLPDTKVFHAGTARSQDQIITQGGRVLGVTSWAPDLPRARQAAYDAVGKIQFDGAHYRRDIGAKDL
jgi:phosphoribosylamine--glycine ligase